MINFRMQRNVIPSIRNNVEFGYVSSATNFSSSLVPCHTGNGHSFQTKNLCSFLAKLNVISDIWYKFQLIFRFFTLSSLPLIFSEERLESIGKEALHDLIKGVLA